MATPITTDDGFIVWGDTYGLRYRIGKGWSRLTTSGVTPASDSNAVWIDGKVVVLWRPAGSSLLAVSSLDGDRWTPPREVRAPLPTLSYQIATAGNWVVVIGFGGETNLPALIDTTRAAAESMAGYPLQTVSGQAITWSGAQFFVWGGQTVRTATSTSAGVSIAAAAGPGDTSDLTNTGAIWTP